MPEAFSVQRRETGPNKFITAAGGHYATTHLLQSVKAEKLLQ
jgi:hypothetical protein